ASARRRRRRRSAAWRRRTGPSRPTCRRSFASRPPLAAAERCQPQHPPPGSCAGVGELSAGGAIAASAPASPRPTRPPAFRLPFVPLDHVGATDELGSAAVECVHPIRDFHVTPHLLGLDDNKLPYFHGGRYKQLSQFAGKVIKELIAYHARAPPLQ